MNREPLPQSEGNDKAHEARKEGDVVVMSGERLRWAIAGASALALAVLTLAAPLPFTFDGIGAAGSGAACPADAKTANLNFTLKDINNQDVRLASLKGKVILMDFWATWCGPCKIEIPWFIEFQKKYGSSGLQVVGISVDDTLDKLKPFVAQMKMNYTVLQGLDHDDVQDAFGPIFGVPVTLVISRDGKICARHVGLSSKPDFESAIKALL
jgi:thiol-disulfide isomerase/thioredoxin